MGLFLSRQIGRVDDHIGQDLGIVGRGKARKGQQVIVGRPGQLLGRSRLSADLISGHPSCLTGAFLTVHGQEHGVSYKIAGGLGYGLPHQIGFHLLHHGSLVV